MRRKSIAVIAAALMVMVAVMAGFTGCGDKSAKSDKVTFKGGSGAAGRTYIPGSDQRIYHRCSWKKKGMLMVKISRSTIRMHRMSSPISRPSARDS